MPTLQVMTDIIPIGLLLVTLDRMA